ncbi:hypothetical protein [Burkholderia ubonensis]|uniref:hypothetical protein n=1 Tax=Burkholderia ubonensis TaxID=101571 RepID=UPI000AFCA6D8|nr:hypothetical protein [Burkholderia ubonensis]
MISNAMIRAAKYIVSTAILMVVAIASASDVRPDQKEEIVGFGSANFGSAEDVVDLAIRKDFAGSEVDSKNDDATGTQIKTIRTGRLSPFGVPARVIYRFGENKTLVQVDVIWDVDEGERSSVNSIKSSISDLIGLYSSRNWTGGSKITGYFIGNAKEGDSTRFIFFRGISDQKRMIALVGWPVYARKGKDGGALSADISKIAKIKATYLLDINNQHN